MIYLELGTVLAFLLFVYYIVTNERRKKWRRIPPGPAGLPLLGYLPFLGLGGVVPQVKITALSKKFGDVLSVYFGQYLVVFVSDVEKMKEMGKMDIFLGRNQLDLMKPIRENCGLIFLEEKGWTEWRRFTLKSLRDFGFGKNSMTGLIQDQVEDFRQYLMKHNRIVSVKEIVEISVINSLWQILAGEKYDMDDPEKREILKMISEGFSDQNILGITAFLPWLARMFPDSTGYSKALKCLGAPIDLAKDIVRRHEENHVIGMEKDFIDHALTKIYETKDPSSSFYGDVGMKNLMFTVLDLFFTGSDTVSSTMGWSFLALAIHPQVQRKVQEEIDLVVGDDRLPGLSDKTRMVYTEATIMEVLRKSSMVPFGVMHTALEDAEFHGFFIPKRTIILWNLYGVHHDEKHWGDPNVFRPERFINPDGSIRRDEHLVPFFTGKRNCPGDSLAINEIFMFVTGVLQKFDIQLEDPTEVPNLDPRAGFIIKPPENKLILTPRSPKTSSRGGGMAMQSLSMTPGASKHG